MAKKTSNPFQSVTRVAIGEIVRSYCSTSRYGVFMSDENVEKLIEDLVKFLETSRNLKAAGDRFLSPAPQKAADIRGNIR